MSINDKIKRLQDQVDWFESDSFDLDEALTRYQSAAKLAQEVEKELTNMKNQVEIIQSNVGNE